MVLLDVLRACSGTPLAGRCATRAVGQVTFVVWDPDGNRISFGSPSREPPDRKEHAWPSHPQKSTNLSLSSSAGTRSGSAAARRQAGEHMPKPATIDDYIRVAPEAGLSLLNSLRALC